MAAVPHELSAKTSAFSTNASLFVRVHLPEYVWRERSVEIIGNTYAASPPAGRPFLANVAQGYETRDRTTGLRNDDFLTRLGAVDQLREAGLRLVDIDVFRHACSRGDPGKLERLSQVSLVGQEEKKRCLSMIDRFIAKPMDDV